MVDLTAEVIETVPSRPPEGAFSQDASEDRQRAGKAEHGSSGVSGVAANAECGSPEKAAAGQSVFRGRVPSPGEGPFRPHYVTWSEQQTIEAAAPEYLRNVVRIITETGLRVYKELAPMRKEDVDLRMRRLDPGFEDSNGVAEVPLTDLAVEAFRKQISISGVGPLPVSEFKITRPAIRPVSKRSGQQLFGRPVCRTSGFTISGPRMRLG